MLATLDIRKARDEKGVEIEPVVKFENAVFRCVFFNRVFVFAFGCGYGSWFGVAFVYSGPAFVFKWELAQRSEDTTLSCNVLVRYATFLASIPFSRSFHVPHPTPTIRALTILSYRTPSPFVCDIRPRSEEALRLIMEKEGSLLAC
jgi:hypothetical protein